MKNRFKKALKKAAVGTALSVGLATGGALMVSTAAPASASVGFDSVFAVKQDGPGLKNWRCVDIGVRPYWYGPWRYTKSGANIDCMSYISRVL